MNEGDKCPACRFGFMYFQESEYCTCEEDRFEPCPSCENVKLECGECGYVEGDEDE